MTNRGRSGRAQLGALTLAVACAAGRAEAGGPTPGYPEAVLQWGVQKGETCEAIAKSLYGSDAHVDLLLRYNRVECRRGVALAEGTTLVLPETVTALPSAHIRSAHPRVRARPPGGGWSPAAAGLPLESNSSVNTLEDGRADIEFIDRTRVFLAQNTLVVLYGATASKSRVSKSSPPSVEIQEGEVKAGLAALRGGAAIVNVPGGGRVDAVSRETVVERKGPRTTVAVFDGKARVASGGATVEVPTNHGTRFVGAARPAPPRPLPPAPAWEAGGSPVVVLAGEGGATLRGGWAEVGGAIRYRVEIARDEAFGDLVVRQEVPSTVRSFRAEKMPAGTYRIAVRAIDREEYLGVATVVRRIEVVDARVEGKGGALGEDAVDVNRYGTLVLGAGADVEIALDDGPFGALPVRLDLADRAPAALALRRKGSSEVARVPLRYAEVSARIDRAGERVVVQLEGVDDALARARVRPSLRVHAAGSASTLALAPEGAARFAVALGDRAAGVTRLDVVDGLGRILGTRADAPDAAPPAPPARPPVRARIGLDAAPTVASALGPTPAWAPTARSQASLATTVDRNGGAWGASGRAQVVGAFDAGTSTLGVEAALRTDVSGEGRADDPAAWFGLRSRLWQRDATPTRAAAGWELGSALRLGVPVTAAGPAPRLEPGLGAAFAWGRWTALLDAGARLRLASDAALPPVQALALLGATYDPASMVRVGALLDASLARELAGDAPIARGGLALALEVGGPWFAGLSARASPWSDAETPLALQLTVGLREAP